MNKHRNAIFTITFMVFIFLLAFFAPRIGYFLGNLTSKFETVEIIEYTQPEIVYLVPKKE